ncbi:MAG: hypothetical protein WBW03_10210 [Silvibacterium sp.]
METWSSTLFAVTPWLDGVDQSRPKAIWFGPPAFQPADSVARSHVVL